MQQPKLVVGIAAVVLLAIGSYVLMSGLGGERTSKPQATSTPEQATTTPAVNELQIGQSVEGRSIRAIQFGTGERDIFFVGGIHGGYEWNSTLVAYNFVDHLTQNPELVPDNLTVHIIPVLNPDGLHSVVGTIDRFSPAIAPPKEQTSGGRLNANDVDLNRNFDCKWQPESTWRSQPVDAGTSPFSEPEAAALRDYTYRHDPHAVIVWHSAADAVFASQCTDGILPETLTLMNTYADAADYPTQRSFDYYEITGASEDWFAKLGVPAVSVELSSHNTVEWDKNRRGSMAVLRYYSRATSTTASSLNVRQRATSSAR
jgi:g-D-glutamyl-meso-diaminopimelate peptidase